MTTKKQIKKMGYTGYLKGKKFDGEWPNGGGMSGYSIYYCEGGEIDTYGDFSKTGKLRDREDAGDCIESLNEKSFTKIKE
jgi:hypothetical protein